MMVYEDHFLKVFPVDLAAKAMAKIRFENRRPIDGDWDKTQEARSVQMQKGIPPAKSTDFRKSLKMEMGILSGSMKKGI